MANAKTKAKGTRVAYATAGTTMAAQVAGAALPGAWTQVLNVQNVDTQINQLERFDDGDLEDADEVPKVTKKPGKITFERSKSSDTVSPSVTLQNLCDGSTKKAWAVIFPDGTVHQTSSGLLSSSSGGKAQNGDLKARPSESYEVIPDGVLTPTEHA